jgi:hypothetical protein
MGYSSSAITLLQALTTFREDASTANTIGSICLEAYSNKDLTADESYQRLGQLKVLPGGVDIDGNFVDMVNFTFEAPSGGATLAYSNASVRTGPYTTGNFYHIFATTLAWIRYGTVAITASVGAGGYPIMPYTVYPFTPTSTLAYIAVIRDTADGTLYVGRADS